MPRAADVSAPLATLVAPVVKLDLNPLELLLAPDGHSPHHGRWRRRGHGQNGVAVAWAAFWQIFQAAKASICDVVALQEAEEVDILELTHVGEREQDRKSLRWQLKEALVVVIWFDVADLVDGLFEDLAGGQKGEPVRLGLEQVCNPELLLLPVLVWRERAALPTSAH